MPTLTYQPKLRLRPELWGSLDNTYARILGGGTDGSPLKCALADKNFLDFRTQCDAASGQSRGIYFKHFLAGAGGEGEAARFYTWVSGTPAGGVHGVHAAVAIDTGATSTGLTVGLRATLGEIVTATRSLSGTFAALQVDSYIRTGNTLPAATTSFIRVADSGEVAVPNLFDIPASTVTRKGSAPTAAEGLAIRLDGVLKYIMIGT